MKSFGGGDVQGLKTQCNLVQAQYLPHRQEAFLLHRPFTTMTDCSFSLRKPKPGKAPDPD